MKKYFLSVFLAFTVSHASGQVQNYKVIPEQSSMTFSVSAKIHRVHGEGNDFQGTISGDPKDITTAKITIRLDAMTFDTNNEKRDKVMREQSLEVEKFPFIEFESSSIEASQKELIVNQRLDAVVTGTLKLHGVEKQISVPVRILWDERLISADAEMDLNLDDFKIFRPKVLFFRLQEDVRIRFRIVAEREEGHST